MAWGKAEASVFGVAADHLRIGNLRVRSGRFLDPIDDRERAQVCVIGPRVARALFGWESPLEKELLVNGVWLVVVGVLEGSGGEIDAFQGISLASSDDAIYLPITTARRKFDPHPLGSPFTELIIRLDDRLDPEKASLIAADAIKRIVDRLHGGAEDYELVVPQSLLNQSQETQRIFNVVMGSIAGISLLVGGIGIMNIMLPACSSADVRSAYVARWGRARSTSVPSLSSRSFLISVIGGAFGIVVGVALAQSIATYAGWPTEVSVAAIVLASLVSIVVGVVSGLYPAIQASELDPIDALRYE